LLALGIAAGVTVPWTPLPGADLSGKPLRDFTQEQLAREVAISRIYAGVHYASDVVAGARLGIAAAESVLDRWRAGTLVPAAADAAFAIACRHNAPAMPGHRYWAIVECDTGRPLGLAALQRRGPQGEFGIMVRVEAWKRRVASRALGLVLEYGFGLLELDTIVVESLGGAHGRMMHRLVAPFGFQPVQGRAARMRAWALPRSRWAQRPPPSGWIFQGPRRRVKES
ncbi:MAG: GNAT family N-acetyltransferase, partial [Proteobacteria bacterium]|nr:GNAT family N-acetyltransferase [Pseudomonadota bacterium]